ncbi:MAG: dihydrofolate reductase, partial [Oscillospiraceae bacterium]|nr:dihydrofolate reductase [Oscillospiraceae bacterium]
MSEPLELRLIVAVDRAWGIGRNNELLFRLSADLRRFKALTMGHVLLMGRHTFDSLPGPLPGREHVVLSRDPAFAPAGVTVCPSAEQALTRARELAGARGAQIFVIGGARVYAALLNTCG